jgi:hypothetical protein
MAEKTPKGSGGHGPKCDPVRLDTHEELTARLPEIFRRLNENPEIGRLTLVNPILALEDIGFVLSDDLQDHLRKTLPFPKGRVRRISKARKRLRELLGSYGKKGKPVHLPKTPRERARLLFDTLGLKCEGKIPDALTVEQLRPFRDQHPIAEALYQVGRLERGTLIFESRGVYESHKAGLPHHSWFRRLHFPEGE